MVGGGGDDQVFGGGGSDLLEGRGGNDSLVAAAGSGTASRLYGGLGDDSLTLGTRARGEAQATLDGGAGADTLRGEPGWICLIDGGEGDDYLSADSNRDTLFGGSGADRLVGSSGADLVNAGEGADTMWGGLGNDTFLVDDVADVVMEGGGGGVDLVISTAAEVVLGNNVDNVRLNGASGQAAIGNGLHNMLFSLDGADTLTGLGGRDTLIGGGGGRNLLKGGTGDDLYIITSPRDVVIETSTGGRDLIDLKGQSSWTLAFGVEDLRHSGTATFVGTGNALDNDIYCNALATLDGGGGNDTLSAYGGSSLKGGDGDDTFMLYQPPGAGGDTTIVEWTKGGTDLLISYLRTTYMPVNVERMVLQGWDLLRAAIGNAQANTIIGASSSESIEGGLGNDTLTGGGDADRFVFSDAVSCDRITDFQVGVDRILLKREAFAAIAGAPAAVVMSAEQFKNIATGTVDADDRMLFDPRTGEIFYDLDGAGAGAAVRFALVTPGLELVSTSFNLFA